MAYCHYFSTLFVTMATIRTVRRERLVPINTTYVYAHGIAKGGLIDVPKNAIVFMQCNPQTILADLAYDLSKFVFALTHANIQCHTFEEYVRKLYQVFNVHGALFCFYLHQCPNMEFSFNDSRLNLKVYNSTDDMKLLGDMITANEVNEEMFHIYKKLFQDGNADKPKWTYEQCVRNEGFLKDEFYDGLTKDAQDNYEKFLSARRLIYKIPMTGTDIKPSVTLQNVFDTLDTNKFHFIIVNTCRVTTPDNKNIMNVSKGVSMKQFNEYKEFQQQGKHSVVTPTAVDQVCRKIEDFNKNNQTQKVYDGGKKTRKNKKTETQKKK